MRITQWGEYGVHCSVYIASRHVQGSETVGAAEVAKSQGLPLQYAQQILHRLRKGGIIESIRGPQGGYRLVRAAKEIRLRDILVAAEGNTFEVICDTKPLNLPRCLDGSCFLRPIWQDLKQQINDYLEHFTLEDLVTRSLTATQSLSVTQGLSSMI